MPIVFIPPSLRRQTAGVKQVDMHAETVRQVVDKLDEQFPGIRQRLCDGDQLKPGLAVAVGSRISELGLLQQVEPNDEVHFVSAVGGG